jgi:serine/threonine protein phosphatase PrpC
MPKRWLPSLRLLIGVIDAVHKRAQLVAGLQHTHRVVALHAGAAQIPAANRYRHLGLQRLKIFVTACWRPPRQEPLTVHDQPAAQPVDRARDTPILDVRAQLVVLADDTSTMSRTHLEFDIDEIGLWVRDCASTNGSEIEVDARRSPMEPGLSVHAPSGCTIHMGARQVKVRTTPSRSAIGAARINWGAATHIGVVRENNQDAYCTTPPVFAVADGVGGHCAGDIAARETVEALSTLTGHVQVTDEMLRACLADARARIGRIFVAQGQPPATTLSGVIATHVDNVTTWLVVNIGDSRTYSLNSGGLRQLSTDHSVVQQLIDMGAIDPCAAQSHQSRNVLTRALRADVEYSADVWRLPMIAGDRILVCSDGLTREVDDRFIASVLRAIPDPQAAANQLVKAAVDAGGHDNVTVLVIDATEVRGDR